MLCTEMKIMDILFLTWTQAVSLSQLLVSLATLRTVKD